MGQDIVAKTREFVKNAFIDNPSYSFGDWSVMYEHSLLVQQIALLISSAVKADKFVISVASLLHDIGKTHDADEKTLHAEHEKFNLAVCEKFLDELDMSEGERIKIKRIISFEEDSVETKIIKDADALAFYADKRLHTLFLDWATKNGHDADIERKLGKFSKLNFDISKITGKVWFEQTKRGWKRA